MDLESEVAAVSKVLGEPVFAELSERAWRVRTTLVVVAMVAIAVSYLNLKVDPAAAVFGLSFSGVTDKSIRIGLLMSVFYLAIHFVWVSWDSFNEWRIRRTGTRVAYVTTGRFGEASADYPGDPRQSTLYNWWRDQA